MNTIEQVSAGVDCIDQLSRVALAELRSDHAGETGAVFIYHGILAMSRSAEIRTFANEHLQTEELHLRTLDELLPKHHQSKCLALWRVSGWSLGAIAAMFSPRFTYATIRAVETFVVEHYQQQLTLFPEPLRALLEGFSADEAHHRDEADAAMASTTHYPIWHWVVATGSALAVKLARRI